MLAEMKPICQSRYDIYRLNGNDRYLMLMCVGKQSRLVCADTGETAATFPDYKSIFWAEPISETEFLFRTVGMRYAIYDTAQRRITWDFQYPCGTKNAICDRRFVWLGNGWLADSYINLNSARADHDVRPAFALNVQTGEIRELCDVDGDPVPCIRNGCVGKTGVWLFSPEALYHFAKGTPIGACERVFMRTSSIGAAMDPESGVFYYTGGSGVRAVSMLGEPPRIHRPNSDGDNPFRSDSFRASECVLNPTGEYLAVIYSRRITASGPFDRTSYIWIHDTLRDKCKAYMAVKTGSATRWTGNCLYVVGNECKTVYCFDAAEAK